MSFDLLRLEPVFAYFDGVVAGFTVATLSVPSG